MAWQMDRLLYTPQGNVNSRVPAGRPNNERVVSHHMEICVPVDQLDLYPHVLHFSRYKNDRLLCRDANGKSDKKTR
jgi:hypothetical protein